MVCGATGEVACIIWNLYLMPREPAGWKLLGLGLGRMSTGWRGAQLFPRNIGKKWEQAGCFPCWISQKLGSSWVGGLDGCSDYR